MADRRRRAWADTLYATSISDDSSGSTNLLAGFTPSDTLTAIRVLGEIRYHATELSEVEFMQAVDVGIGVSSAEAFNVANEAGLPAPNVAGDYPPRGWLYIARKLALQALPTGGTPTAMWRQDAVFEFDVRGNRKIDKGILFLAMHNTQLGTTGSSLRITGRVRVLCLT